MKHKRVKCLDLSPNLKVSYYICANTKKYEKLKKPKDFWSQTFWIGDTQPVMLLLLKLYPIKRTFKTVL